MLSEDTKDFGNHQQMGSAAKPLIHEQDILRALRSPLPTAKPTPQPRAHALRTAAILWRPLNASPGPAPLRGLCARQGEPRVCVWGADYGDGIEFVGAGGETRASRDAGRAGQGSGVGCWGTGSGGSVGEPRAPCPDQRGCTCECWHCSSTRCVLSCWKECDSSHVWLRAAGGTRGETLYPGAGVAVSAE